MMTTPTVAWQLGRRFASHHQFGWITVAALATTTSPAFSSESLPFDFPGNSAAFISRGVSTLIQKNQNETTQQQNTGSTFETLQSLANRLQQPALLRASTNGATSKLPEKRRSSELALTVARNYVNLPPLRLPTDEKEPVACERCQVLEFLATNCRASDVAVEKAVRKYENCRESAVSGNATSKDPKKMIQVLSNLRNATTPPYEDLLEFVQRQNAAEGMVFLVSLREDLMQLSSYYRSIDHHNEVVYSRYTSQLQDLDSYLQSTFMKWFAPGMLELRRITYDETPASVIEFISTKEAVHPMKSLEDLRRRLGPTRRVFALFHPLLANRPLVFVHIALIEQGEDQHGSQDLIQLVPSSMNHVMNTVDKELPSHDHNLRECFFRPKIATFYSISNAIKGLAGVGLGEHLIKEAVKLLRQELPSLQMFVTLSPIPGFRKWLQVKILQHNDESLLSTSDRQALLDCGLVSSNTKGSFPWSELWMNLEQMSFDTLEMTQYEDDDRRRNAGKQQTVMQATLLKLACRYLVLEKHRGKPLDGVCKFHVGNGAEILKINFAADLSRRGSSNSFGIMVNYLYELDRLEENRANFESNYLVPVSPHIQKLLEDEKPVRDEESST